MICMRLSRIFGVLIIILGMRSGKMMLKNFFSYFVVTSEQNYHYVQMKLLDRLIGGGKTVVSTINVGLYCKIIFVVCTLHTFFMHLRQTK